MAFTDYYVDVSLGADGAGTSGSPYRWSQVITRLTGTGAAGDRYYIRGTGTGLADLTATLDATILNPIALIGCGSDWTPCRSAGRTGNGYGPLSTTDFPSLTFAANAKIDLNGADYYWAECLKVAVSGTATFGIRTGVGGLLYRCDVVSSRDSTSAEGITVYGGESCAVDCDAEMTGASCRAAIFLSGTNCAAIGCRVKGTGATAGNGIQGASGGLILFNQIMNCAGRGISEDSSTLTHAITAMFNTVYDCADAYGTADYAYSRAMRVMFNMFTDCSGYAIGGASTSDLCGIFLFNRIRDCTSGEFNAGIWNDWATLAIGHITTDTGGPETDYEGATSSPPDLRLITASPGKGAGLPKYIDIGGCQREEPEAGGSTGGGLPVLGVSVVS